MGYPSTTLFAGQACSGISLLGAGGQGFFLPEHMGGGLVLGFTVISVLGCFIFSFGLCTVYAEAGNFQDNISP